MYFDSVLSIGKKVRPCNVYSDSVKCVSYVTLCMCMSLTTGFFHLNKELMFSS